MPRFDYVPARSVEHALELLNEPGVRSRPLAGGTDILVYVRQAPPPFDRLVDISRLPELKRIELAGDRVHLGAGVSFAEATESELLGHTAQCLVEACQTVGSPQIRNAGTLGGNVVNAAACADTLPPLVCLDAVAHVRGSAGTRQLPVSELVLGPNRNALLPGELLTHFSFAVPPAGAHSAFIKLGRRNAQAISRLSMAAMGRLDETGRADVVRLVPGAAAPLTIRFQAVEAMLLGKAPDALQLQAAGEKVAAAMIALAGRRWSTAYKEVAIRALAERALRRVFSNSPELISQAERI